ncbi:hypothetical protein JD844_008401 [Phrynosoma platyrhinos]|uniref:A disintegrin and metalloproteinase with thrombospondin motifs 12 n=1 Tax=Phrynosoma platyrhinos TaxID=52577 RepID=A0ABQ7TDS0_PHRPL|nr:hypothetical protein JD844_008401 [Phrynosoma platyrhinos]
MPPVSETLNFFKHQELRREKWERNHLMTKAISRRSVSRERWVETLVVADSKMIEYHGSENVEDYILTIINMVAGLFHDPSIGNAIHIVLVRLILLEEEEQGLKIVHHADKTLASFCKWQKSINPKTDNNPLHHDVAVLLTSFGIQHDGKENDCEPVGRRPYIMSRQLQYDPTPLTWSHCSKEYITRFLDRGWGFCLDDVPKKKDLKPPFIAPGVLYDVHHQCQLQYGPNATFCDQVDNICQTLWCLVKGSCRSKLDAAADGTRCGENKWCFTGKCITVGKSPEAVHGGWGSWSPWSHCTRTCGAGIQMAERQCNNPEPQFGGKYCTGERKRYRMCNIKLCPKVTPNFRQMQCSEFDTVAYKNEFYQWIPIYNTANPCELQCRPANNHFSEKMLDAVIDGTPCFEGNNSRDICINGMCKTVGCDYEIDSNATEDRCGVCQGDGSSCQTVQITFNQSEGLGYVDIGLIPKGARNIKVTEVAEAGNFLALRSEDPEKYYLNGGFIIQWNGDYKVAGTIFQYERKGDLENLTAPGPTNESVWLQLLFQENNPGIKYEYTVRKGWSSENDIEEPEYFWQYGSWTGCSVTCGHGFQRQTARCVKRGKGVVKNLFCDPETQPNGKQKKCIEKDCPPRWWAGEWQKCSTTCGPTGEKKRTVLCIQAVGSDEQALPAEECQHLLKPKTRLSCNRDILCPSDWTVSNWTECTVTCGGGVRTRNITCPKNNGEPCDILKKPHSKALCGLQQCPPTKRPLIPHLKLLNGKIIRRIGSNTQRGPVNDLPTQKPRAIIPTTTISTSTSTNTAQPANITVIPTSFGLMNSSQQEDLEVTTIIQNNSSGPSIRKDYSYVFSDNSSLKNSTWRPLTNNSSVSNFTDVGNISIIKPCNSSECSFINKNSIITDLMSWVVTPEYNYSTEVSNIVSNSADGGAKDKVQSEQPTRFSVTGQTSTTSPTVSRSDSSSQVSVIPVTGEILLTTVGPQDLPAQINIPSVADPVTEQPAQLDDTLGDENKTTPKSSSDRTSSWPTKSPFLRDPHVPTNQDNTFKTVLWNNSDPEDSIDSRTDAYWIVGNWSEVSVAPQQFLYIKFVFTMEKILLVLLYYTIADIAISMQLSQEAFLLFSLQCSSNCGGGFKTRDAYCLDVRDNRILRPFHCQIVGRKPQLNVSCNKEPCFKWRAEPWNECPVSCGGGIRQRVVQCISMEGYLATEESMCEHKTKPTDMQKCNQQDCTESAGRLHSTAEEPHIRNTENPTKQGLPCSKDRLSTHFCKRVKDVGKCSMPSVWKQCCSTCKRPWSVSKIEPQNLPSLKP